MLGAGCPTHSPCCSGSRQDRCSGRRHPFLGRSPWVGDTEMSLRPKCESCQVAGTEGARGPSRGYPGQASPPPAPRPARGDLPPGGSSLRRDPLSEPEREQRATSFSPTTAFGLPPTHFGIRPVCPQPTRVAGEGSVPLCWRDLGRASPQGPCLLQAW